MYAGSTWVPNQSAAAWQTPWLLSKRWDLTYISLSALLVPVPLFLFYVVGLKSEYIDILVAMIVGGPHMTSTYTLTFMDGRFVKRHPQYVGLALLLPVMVTGLGLLNIRLLLTVFMMWASVHVLHQIAYICDCYRQKGEDFKSIAGRAIDYGVIFTSLYPIAAQRLVDDHFFISGTQITLPAALHHEWLVYLSTGLFFFFLALYIGKTYLEVQQRRANWPKTLLMSITVVLAFNIGRFDNLDVAFQGMNVWHSFQYLGLTWYLNRLRQEQGQIDNRVVADISKPRHGLQFYLFNVGMTVAAGLAVVVLNVLGLPWLQSYYIVILSCLLIHYYFDHFLFVTRVDAVSRGTWV